MSDTSTKNTDLRKSALPFVSVVMPAYNSEKFISKCLDPLSEQDYPKELYEIIVVDNGSIDRTPEIARKYEKVELLFEIDVHSSYAARNTGIKKSRGEIIALIDADCIPEMNWITEGVKAMIESNADMVGGPVKYFFDKMTGAELFDAYSHFNNEKLILEKRAALTGNLFLRRRVFEEFGLFPQDAESGADFRFTNGAINAGFSIVYAENAIVWHPTRKLFGLLKKVYRTGRGMPKAFRQIGEKNTRFIAFRRFIKDLLIPKKPFYFKRWSMEKNLNLNAMKLIRMDFAHWLTTAVYKFAIMIETFRSKTKGSI